MDEVSSVTNVDLSNQVSVLVAKKAMDVDKEQAQALVDMIRQATPPAPRQDGQGRLDLYA
jgi:hypothetical protein